MTLTDTFAATLVTMRKSRGLTQAALAAQAGIAPAYVSMLERGQRSPPLDTLEALSRALGLGSPLYLLGGVPTGAQAAA